MPLRRGQMVKMAEGKDFRGSPVRGNTPCRASRSDDSVLWNSAEKQKGAAPSVRDRPWREGFVALPKP